MTRRSIPALVVLGLLRASIAHPSGYSLYEQGAAVMGMAGAGTASANDPSALFYQPAAITSLGGQHLQVGGHLLTPVISFAGTPAYPGYGVTEEMTRQNFALPNLYYTWNSGRHWAIGAALNAPFGLGIEWRDPETFTGRTIVTKGDLRTLGGSLTAAWARDARWSVAGGLDVLYAKVALHNIETAVLPGGGGATANVAHVDLESDYTPDYGWHAGVSATPNEHWKVGLNFRSAVSVTIDDGKATFTQQLYDSGNPAYDGPFNAAVAAGLPPNQTVGTTLRFPALWSAGVAWLPKPEWTVEGDLNLIQWSIFQDLPIRFSLTPSADRTIAEHYKNALQVRLGAEHRLPKWTYRFGYYFDQGAAPAASVSPLLPESDRHAGTLGVGLPIGTKWTLDAYELAIFPVRARTDGENRDHYDGEYKSYVNAAGLSLTTRW